jgi:hypothetical protein
MGEALEGKEEALQNVGAALREKEASLSSLEEAARAQREEAQKNITGEYLRVFVDLFLFVAYIDFLCPELRQKVADESLAKEAVHTALTAAQMEFAELEQTAVSMCQELEADIPPIAEFDATEDQQGGMVACRKTHGSPGGVVEVRRSR